VKRKRLKYLKVDREVHKVLAVEAVSNDINLEDLTTALLEKSIEDGSVESVIEELTPDEDEDEDEEE